MTHHDVAVLGTGMTDMSRRDLSPETMAYQVVHEALGDSGLSSHDLGLVIVGNAMAHRLSDQGCQGLPNPEFQQCEIANPVSGHPKGP